MSDKQTTAPKFDQIDPELVEKVSGGECTAQEYIEIWDSCSKAMSPWLASPRMSSSAS
jgi:hypothetical protein